MDIIDIPLIGITGLPLSQNRTRRPTIARSEPNRSGPACHRQQRPGRRRAGHPGAAAGLFAINGVDHFPPAGDIIVAVDGHPVRTGGELRAYIEKLQTSR